MIEIWTDGACRGNGKENAYGGWAFAILKDGELISTQSGAQLNTTNNRMELLAVINGIIQLQYFFTVDEIKEVTIITDSAYIYNCWKNGWYKSWIKNNWKNSKNEPVKNIDLWKKLLNTMMDSHYTFKKVQGHNGNYYNELVDKLATSAADGLEV